MTGDESVTRQHFDRLVIEAGTDARLSVHCANHTHAGLNAFYKDGCLRLLCGFCGFEVVSVKISA